MVFACLPLWKERCSAYRAFLENRKPQSPWDLFDELKLPPNLQVLAVACYRGVVAVLAARRLLLVFHNEGKWILLADNELPFGGKPWTPLETIAVCSQCVVFAYRNEEENCCYIYAIPLSEAGKQTTPIKARVNGKSLRLVVPEEIYDADTVYGSMHDHKGRTARFCVNLKKSELTVGNACDCPWPTISNTDFMRIFRGTVCYYSRERKQILFFDYRDTTTRFMRPVANDVLSVEIFQGYALVHYVNDEIELVNIYGKYRIISKLTRTMMRQFADIATHGIPSNYPVKPFHSTRTFSSSLFVMLHDGSICQFKSTL